MSKLIITMDFEFLKKICKANMIEKCMLSDKNLKCDYHNCPIIQLAKQNAKESNTLN